MVSGSGLIWGCIAGLLATVPMTCLEYLLYRKKGMIWVLEFHVNMEIAALFAAKKKAEDLLRAGMAIHFIHGLGGGLVFAWVLMVSEIDAWALGAIFAVTMWIIGLGIHRPMTGLNPIRHPAGSQPMLFSLVGHVIYGVTLVAVTISVPI